VINVAISYGHTLGAHFSIDSVGRRIIGGDGQGIFGQNAAGRDEEKKKQD
jgi:hypothetical protein